MQVAESTTNALGIDPLTQWEIRVAQRADQLAAKTVRSRDQDLECWLQAEREVLAETVSPTVDFVA